jgi:hypothetical protein
MLIFTQYSPIHSFYLPTQWSRILLEKLTGFHLVKKFHAFTKLEGSLPHSQVPAICPYLTVLTTNFNKTCKRSPTANSVFIWLCLIMMRKNFSLCMYITPVLRFYSVIITVSLQMCAVGTNIWNDDLQMI